MNERLSDEERAALIAEHANEPRTPDAAEDLSILTDLLADPSTWAEPPSRLEEAVVHGAEGAPSPAPATAEETRPTRRRRTLGRRTPALSAVAVAAAIAIALGTFTVLRSSPTPDYTAQLAATSVVPGAHASADITHNNAGFRIALQAHGLAKLPAGEYYQAWLKNAAGTLVPIGTFSASDAKITLWSGVSPSLFPTLTVTIEKADNNQQSSGRRVLIGEVRAG
jgi:anti-sigma-K factor RskA